MRIVDWSSDVCSSDLNNALQGLERINAMLLWRARMRDSIAPSGIDPASPSLSVRLRELADYLAAPTAGRLTEEQRALSLGIARRLTVELAARLDPAIDGDRKSTRLNSSH